MKMHRGFCLLAAAAVAVALTGGQARAAYTYSTSLVITGFSGTGTATNTPGVGSTFLSAGGTGVAFQDILTPGTFLTTASLTANIGNVGVGTTSAAPESFTVSYTDTVTITNPVAGSIGSFQVKGTLTLTNVQNVGGSTSGTISNLYTAPFAVGPTTIGPNDFTMSFGTGAQNDFFGPPTIGTSNAIPFPITTKGNLGAQINAVPEPSSMALVGLGVTGLFGYRWRRRQAARRLRA